MYSWKKSLLSIGEAHGLLCESHLKVFDPVAVASLLGYIFIARALLDGLVFIRAFLVKDVFFAVNAKSALKLGHVRGVAMLSAAACGLPVVEYAPLSIKSAVVGHGLAAKEQVQFMVARLLDLDRAPEPPDAADALAIAICHIHNARTAQGLAR